MIGPYYAVSCQNQDDSLCSELFEKEKGNLKINLSILEKEGFARVRVDGEILYLDDLPEDYKLEKNKKHSIEIVVDRLVMRKGIESRLADSLGNLS